MGWSYLLSPLPLTLQKYYGLDNKLDDRADAKWGDIEQWMVQLTVQFGKEIFACIPSSTNKYRNYACGICVAGWHLCI